MNTQHKDGWLPSGFYSLDSSLCHSLKEVQTALTSKHVNTEVAHFDADVGTQGLSSAVEDLYGTIGVKDINCRGIHSSDLI